jgi:hypothetical protein
MRRVVLPALITALSAGSACAADEAAARRDLRCVLVVGIIAGAAQDSASDTTKQGLVASIGYYLGRLKGRDPGIDLTARISAEARGLKLADLQAEAARCGEELKVFGQESQQVGAALKALGAEVGKTATD